MLNAACVTSIAANGRPRLSSAANTYVDRAAPWNELKNGNLPRVRKILSRLLRVLEALSVMLWPAMPTKADAMRAQLGLPPVRVALGIDIWPMKMPSVRAGLALAPAGPLFPTYDEKAQAELLERVRPSELKTVEAFLNGLSELKRQRGSLITLKEVRSIDVARVEVLEKAVEARFGEVSCACVDFFLAENAFQPLLDRLDVVVDSVGKSGKTTELVSLRKELDTVHEGLTLLSETIASLPIDDPTVRTKILDGTSSAFAQQNRARAVLDGRQKELGAGEGRAEFGVQFKLLSQSVTSALALANTPEACDEQLGRLMLQLEELEGRFGELDEFSVQLAEKREDVLDAVNAKRQLLVEERQRRAQSLATAAERVLAGIVRRAQTAKSQEELNGYFASDAMVHKLTELSGQLRELGDSVRADELDSKLKSAKQNAIRALRDKTDLLEDDGNVIRFGQHRFSVNTRPSALVAPVKATSVSPTISYLSVTLPDLRPSASIFSTASGSKLKEPGVSAPKFTSDASEPLAVVVLVSPKSGLPSGMSASSPTSPRTLPSPTRTGRSSETPTVTVPVAKSDGSASEAITCTEPRFTRSSMLMPGWLS